MLNTHVHCSIWYADDAMHVFLVGVIALVLVAVCSTCAIWNAPSLGCNSNIAGHRGSN